MLRLRTDVDGDLAETEVGERRRDAIILPGDGLLLAGDPRRRGHGRGDLREPAQ